MNKLCNSCKNISVNGSGQMYCGRSSWVDHGGGYGGHYNPTWKYDDTLDDHFEPMVESKVKEIAYDIQGKIKTHRCSKTTDI